MLCKRIILRIEYNAFSLFSWLIHLFTHKHILKEYWFFLGCNCHNKTEDCYYDQRVADEKKSINIFGQFKGGGVCINCTQHTTGINCDMCNDGYYRPQKVRGIWNIVYRYL